MRVFALTTGSDTAGINVAIKNAFSRHAPDWHVDSMVASQNYIGYPVDVPWSQRDLERLYDAADVVHVHNTLHAHRWYDNGQGKPTVLMHHGMDSLAEFRAIVREAEEAGVSQVGSTLDLSLLEPGVEWLPAPVDLAEMRRIREGAEAGENLLPGVIRIGHAPTNRAIKGSDAFERAVDVLIVEGFHVMPVLIERLPWTDCLRRKASCDLFFDQPVLGYGSNAIEAWAMGIPVVSGVADPQIRAGMIERWGRLPFFEANEATLTDALRALVTDPDLRAEYSARGTAHVERWHDERVTVASLKRIYSDAKPSQPGGSEKRLSAETLAKIARHERQDAGRVRRQERVSA